MLTTVADDICAECLAVLTENGRCRHCRPSGSYETPPPPPCPTKHMPGSTGKVEVMRWRDDQGYQVHHADDATSDERPNGPSRFCYSNVVRELRIGRVLMNST
jgi:hypothetical protein